MKTVLESLQSGNLLVSVAGWSGRPVHVSRVCADSRKATRGCLFAAIRGRAADGLRFAEEAVRRGARGVLVDRPVRSASLRKTIRVRVTDSARALGVLASRFHGGPTRRIRVYGVTGTNGKTTTTYLIRHLLYRSGGRAALLGTVSEEIPGRPPVASSLTTPDALKMNEFFARALSAGCETAVCEVSSHSLDQRRVWGLSFDTVIFTNLTQDHLDYHKTMEDYFEAKRRLFIEYGYRQAVINTDDPFGRRLAAQLRRLGRPVVTYGRRPGAGIRILSSTSGLRGTRSRLMAFGRPLSLRLRLIGDYNLSNAVAALAACSNPDTVRSFARALENAPAPPGRMERVDGGRKFVVLVDYAHTPDALEKLLGACRRLHPRRLICVFGCGGDRDRTKRPKMGRIATSLADFTVVTSDNPRTEPPMSIIREIQPGLSGRSGARYVIEPDRRSAIRMACGLARPRDVVAIAGKGHEDYQIIGTTKYPFDDRQIAREALRSGRSRPAAR